MKWALVALGQSSRTLQGARMEWELVALGCIGCSALYSLCSPIVQNEACSRLSQEQVLGLGVERVPGGSWSG